MRIPLEVSLVLRYLHQERGESLMRLTELYPQFKRTTIYRHMKKPINQMEIQHKKSPGRPRKVTAREERRIDTAIRKLREVKGNFSGTDIRNECEMFHIAPRTFRRVLNRMGYKFRQCRKKGILSEEDTVKRLAFARKCQTLPRDFWKTGISFYLDGVSFVYKTNPNRTARTSRTRTWMRKGDTLKRHCTAKGRKEGTNGRTVHFLCAIAYGRGFIECYQYSGHIDGEKCKEFIESRFPEMFENSANTRGKLFLQDGDPSQNSRLAIDAMNSTGCRLFKIPARSPDLNPIENAFHNIRRTLSKQAIDGGLTNESYQKFCQRVRRTILNYSAEVIDRTIESMPKRVDLVIKNKGLRTKY